MNIFKKTPKSFFYTVLQCPKCQGSLNFKTNNCNNCQLSFLVENTSIVFLDVNGEYIDKRSTREATNPYSSKTLNYIKEHPKEIILDFGSGNPAPDELNENVLLHDFVRYDTTNIVSKEKYLPYKDNSMDAVVSESVFEHVADPFLYAREINRILKPGGEVIVDTAFLQPVHADPYHYFNMTIEGLKEVFNEFDIYETGVESYQNCSMTMKIMARTFASLISDEKVRKEFQDKYQTDFSKYDQFIPKDKQYIMSAGIYLRARKK